MENKIYLALGEEATRGVKEATTVGFIPLLAPSIPKMEFDDKKREEYRGEDTVLGETTVMRMSRKWSSSIEMPFFTEAGVVAASVGTLLKHFFGRAASVQNAATGQYAHMLAPVSDPFATANLGTKALTLNLNINEGISLMNWPFVGGRVSSLTLDQEPGAHLKVSADLFGQFRDTMTAELGGAVFAAENLRADYNNLSVYVGGAPVRTGSAPDYTDITKGTAVKISPDKITVKIENGMEDALRLSGLDYPDKTSMGKYKVSLDMTIDWEDPASGFSSVDDFNAWMAASSETSFLLIWDTGTPAGTGDNHTMILDIPRAQRTGGEPDYNRDKDPKVSLSYEGLFDKTTTKYIIGVLLKNTAVTI